MWKRSLRRFARNCGRGHLSGLRLERKVTMTLTLEKIVVKF
jgi:hypothetical protein